MAALFFSGLAFTGAPSEAALSSTHNAPERSL
jgi:hypothetical protein